MNPGAVLLVEDSPTTRKLVRFTLQSNGIELVEAGDGATAERLFAERSFGLVLQDLLLPDTDGFDLIGRLRSLPGGTEVPILAFSGIMSEQDEARVSVAGFDDLIPKPIEPSRLLALVRAHLGADAARGDQALGAGRSLLLVDDDAVQRKLALFRFQQQGFRVEAAVDGEEALEKARASRPDAIVSDVLMPRMDGFQLSMAVRRDAGLADVPLILTTNSYVEPEDRELALKAGADALVFRTPDLKGVFEAVRERLSGPRPAPPRAASLGSSLEGEHLDRVMRQLERQVALGKGAMQRSGLLAAEIALLSAVSEALASNESIEVALEHALAACFDAAAISSGALYTYSAEGASAIGFGASGNWKDDLVELVSTDEVKDILLSETLIHLPGDGAPSGLADHLLERTGAESALLVPLRYRSELLGALLMLNGARLTGPDRVAFLRAVTSQIGQALALTRAFAARETSERAARAQAAEVLERAREIEELNRSLQERDRLLAIAGRTARLGGWSVDLGQDTVQWTDETCAIHDAPPGTVPLVSEAMDFYVPECRPVIRRHFDACLESGVPYDLELEIVTLKGRRVWVRAIGEAVRGDDGAIVRVQGAFQDISARKEAEARVRRLDQLLARTLESITEAFFTLDQGWRFTYVNREAENLLRRPREKLIGRVLWDEFPEAVGSRFETEYRRAVTSGDAISFEEFYSPLGIWVAARAFPSEDGLAVYCNDVSEHRAAQAALRASEERFRILGRATADTLWDWDLVTGTVWRSEGMTSVFGYGAREVQPTPEWLFDQIHIDDRERVENSLRKAIEGGAERWEAAYRLRKRNSDYARVADRGFVVRGEDGKATRVVGGLTDRTEHNLAQERIREQASLLDEARDAIVLLELDGTVAFWNRGAERLYGLPTEEAIARSIEELVYRSPDAHRQAHAQLLERGDWSGELEQVRQDGSAITIEGRWTLVKDAAGTPHRVMCINTDVTEQRKLQAQFLRTQRLESIGTLAGGIAHDLNNVLTPIMMSVGVLREMAPGEAADDILETLEDTTARGAALVQQVLAFARGVEGVRTGVDVGRLVRDVVKIARETFPKNLTLRTEIPEDLWPLQADPTQIHQVLLNLCVNARDAMPDGGTLRIDAENVDIDESYAAMSPPSEPGRYVRLRVVDTGQGIPPEVIDRIFDPFFSTKGVGQGTGLGLSTVDGIVRSHRGFVTVASEPGRGTTFTVNLPASSELLVGEGADAPVAPRRGNGELVLVVDDEEAVRKVASQTLETFGYQVVTAVDGADALTTYARRGDEVQVVLTDLRMPIMDGSALIQALRRIEPRVRVIAASGVDADATGDQFTALGVEHFLPKPYTAERLLEVVHDALGGGSGPARPQ